MMLRETEGSNSSNSAMPTRIWRVICITEWALCLLVHPLHGRPSLMLRREATAQAVAVAAVEGAQAVQVTVAVSPM